MVLVTCSRPLRPGLVRRMLCRSANSIGGTSALAAMVERRSRQALLCVPRQGEGAVLLWFAATRPLAIDPVPVAPPVSENHGRWAGAFIWVRTQMCSLAASLLICSINSRALFERPGRAAASCKVMDFPPDRPARGHNDRPSRPDLI